jgi:hypothetical protein
MSRHENLLRALVQEYSPTVCPRENATWGQAALELDRAAAKAEDLRNAWHKARENAVARNDCPDEAVTCTSLAYSAALRVFDSADSLERNCFFRCAYLVMRSLARDAAKASDIPDFAEVAHA